MVTNEAISHIDMLENVSGSVNSGIKSAELRKL